MLRLRFFMIIVLAIYSCNPTKLAQRCRESFPCIEKPPIVRIDTAVVSDTIIFGDIYTYVDTTECPPSATTSQLIRYVTREIPGKTVYKTVTITRDSTIYLTDQATEAVLRDSLGFLKKRIAGEEKKVRRWAIVVGGLVGLAILAISFFLQIKRSHNGDNHH